MCPVEGSALSNQRTDRKYIISGNDIQVLPNIPWIAYSLTLEKECKTTSFMISMAFRASVHKYFWWMMQWFTTTVCASNASKKFLINPLCFSTIACAIRCESRYFLGIHSKFFNYLQNFLGNTLTNCRWLHVSHVWQFLIHFKVLCYSAYENHQLSRIADVYVLIHC